jgi:hypothetical protein
LRTSHGVAAIVVAITANVSVPIIGLFFPFLFDECFRAFLLPPGEGGPKGRMRDLRDLKIPDLPLECVL